MWSYCRIYICVLQASLGTTKYCSYFLKSMQCPKPDCMYLHELGDEAASFTKEEMQVSRSVVVQKTPLNLTLKTLLVSKFGCLLLRVKTQ